MLVLQCLQELWKKPSRSSCVAYKALGTQWSHVDHRSAPVFLMVQADRAVGSSVSGATCGNPLAKAPVPDAGLLRACPISHMGCCLLRRKIITARGNSRKLSFLLGYLSLGAPESLAGSTQAQWGEPVAAASSS